MCEIQEAFNVYKDVYENAVENFAQTEKRFKAEKASELEYTRAKSVVANAIPNVYNAESSIILALWQLKAVMGVDLERNIDVAGALGDYSTQMFKDIQTSVSNNTHKEQVPSINDDLIGTFYFNVKY